MALAAVLAVAVGGLLVVAPSARAQVPATEQAELTASDADSNDLFGGSVAISRNTAVVGAPSDFVGNLASGPAYVFVRTDPFFPIWTQQAKLIASDGAFGDHFGVSVGISIRRVNGIPVGETIVVGASDDDSLKGSAYVFVRPAGGCVHARLRH